MSEEDILKIANRFPSMFGFSDIIKFARAIEAHTLEKHREERNKIELWRGLALTKGGDGRAIAQIEKEAAEKEREICALLCEKELSQNDGISCAEAIRARGE